MQKFKVPQLFSKGFQKAPLMAHPYQRAIFDLHAIFCKSLWHKQV